MNPLSDRIWQRKRWRKMEMQRRRGTEWVRERERQLTVTLLWQPFQYSACSQMDSWNVSNSKHENRLCTERHFCTAQAILLTNLKHTSLQTTSSVEKQLIISVQGNLISISVWFVFFFSFAFSTLVYFRKILKQGYLRGHVCKCFVHLTQAQIRANANVR